jgi:hypothetical protein
MVRALLIMNIFKSMMIVFIFIHGICNGLEVAKTDYQREKTIIDGYTVSFEFHLEEILGNIKIAETVKKLVYNDLNTDDYIAYKSNEFIKNYANDSGSGYVENITVNYFSNSFAIFHYISTVYYSDTWYSEHIWGYHIIDLKEQKILELNELTLKIPEDELKKIILSQNDIVDYGVMNTEVWPPDSLSFEKDGVLFSWHSYSKILILPQRYEIYVKMDYEFIKPYLTDKGKELMQNILESGTLLP